MSNNNMKNYNHQQSNENMRIMDKEANPYSFTQTNIMDIGKIPTP